MLVSTFDSVFCYEMVSVISSLKNLASFQIAKLFWKSSFKIEGLHMSEIQRDAERNWEIQLTIYRDEAVCNVNSFIKKNKLSSCFKNILTESIFLLHEEYHQLLLWKITYDPRNEIDVFEEGEFYAPKYFSANGRFNDVLWIKRLMYNQNCSTTCRFSLAIAYFLEKDCCTLCNQLDNFYGVSLESEVEYLVKSILWIASGLILKAAFKLRCVLEPIEHGEIPEINYSPEFFYMAALKGYEHAVYKMWKNMSRAHKLDMMENDRFFEIISGGGDFPRCHVSYFLYSQLEKDRKDNFLSWSIQHDESEIWFTLLLTSSMKEAYFEILEFIYKLPIAMYSKLLQSLSRRIRQLKHPLDAELFEMLWNRKSLDEKHTILKNGIFIIENLVKAKSFYNVGCIIKSLSPTQRNRCLLNGWYGAGVKILDVLCKEGEFGLLQKYLSFFLIDMDLCNKVQNLRKDYIFILKKFRESFKFKTWCKNKLSKAEKTEVNSRIDALQACSSLLHDLCKEESNIESSQSSRISRFEKHFVVKEIDQFFLIEHKKKFVKRN